MLSYARGSDSRQEPVDLVVLVKSVIALVEKDLSMNRVNLHTHFEAQPEVSLNPNQIQQVLVNLIVNARQAMPTGGRLDLAVRLNAEANMAEVIVRDSGAGIPSEQLHHIFDQFYTTKEADENGQGGTGLGLSLAKEVMEAHHGRIRVESAVGKGNRIHTEVPAFYRCHRSRLKHETGGIKSALDCLTNQGMRDFSLFPLNSLKR